MTGPGESQRAALPRSRLKPTPPGHFLSDELESDCARFLEDVRMLVRRREQDLGASASAPAC